jgi:hypothetical protein
MAQYYYMFAVDYKCSCETRTKEFTVNFEIYQTGALAHNILKFRKMLDYTLAP